MAVAEASFRDVHAHDVARVDEGKWVGIAIVLAGRVDDNTVDDEDRLRGSVQRVRTADADGVATTRGYQCSPEFAHRQHDPGVPGRYWWLLIFLWLFRLQMPRNL